MTDINLLNKMDMELYDYIKTKAKVDLYFTKYKNFKDKSDVIRTRVKSSLSEDNMGIYSSGVSNPTENKVEQLLRISKFIDDTDKILKLLKNDLTKAELIYLEKGILKNYRDDDISLAINYGRTRTAYIRKSCYIKVARWFDLEVYSVTI